MKKTTIILTSLTALLLLFSCEKAKLLTFTLSYSSAFTISSGVPLNLPFDIPTPDVTTNSASEFESNKTAANLVKDVTLTDLKLTVTSPEGRNFDFLKAVHVFISLGGSDETEIAYIDDIPKGVTSITLTSTNARLDKYIKESTFSLKTRATTREILTQDVGMLCNMSVKVTADPL